MCVSHGEAWKCPSIELVRHIKIMLWEDWGSSFTATEQVYFVHHFMSDIKHSAWNINGRGSVFVE